MKRRTESLKDESDNRLCIERLSRRTVIRVITRNPSTPTSYELIVLDPKKRRVFLNGGKHFTKNGEEVWFRGSKGTDNVLKAGWIIRGLRLEFGLEGGSATLSTGEVESFEILKRK